MTQIFTASIALILGLLLWGVGKKPRKFSNSLSKENFFTDPNQSRISLVKNFPKRNSGLIHESSKLFFQIPDSLRERINLRRKLFKLISSGPEERLLAVKTASSWGDASLLPILRRGLKDSDSRIVITSAEGIQQHRKICKNPNIQLKERPPRNIFLMR